jgi:4-amino-4-deoxy-L-arabinose transferase-like glycosyltransferase
MERNTLPVEEFQGASRLSEESQTTTTRPIIDLSFLRDKWLWGAIVFGFLIRLVPILLWGNIECTRDECIYQGLGERILAGDGLTVSKKGWLAAPGFPYTLAFAAIVFGKMQAVKRIHLLLAALSTGIMYLLGFRVGQSKKVGRIAAWLYAIHPTLAYFVGTMWTETFYSTFLILAALSALWAREGRARRGLLVGGAIGLAMLYRGAATYLLPIFVIGLIWPEEWTRQAIKKSASSYWRHALVMVVTAVVCVAPYSIHASGRHGGFLVTDATLGHVAYLGDNTFEPLTFDYGNGMLTGTIYAKYLRSGRKPCSRRVPPVKSSDCEVERAVRWAKNHPTEFLSRIPLRCAQLLNPHTFLSRHMRWGYWPGLPYAVKEALVLYVAATSFIIVLFGTIGAFARARGVYGVVAVGTVLYHVATVAGLYGMSRFRLPLEPLWMIFLAMFLAEPRETLRMLRHSPGRITGALMMTPILFWLMIWFAGTGFPGFFGY